MPAPQTRRELLRTLGATASVVAAGTALPGCAGPGGASPTANRKVATVQFQLKVSGIPINPTVTGLIQQYVDENFNSRHRGVRAIAVPTAGNAASGVVAAILAGSPAPLVLTGGGSEWSTILPFVAPLDPYFRQDNVQPSLWPSQLLAGMSTDGHLYGVPFDAAAQAYIYRQDILDELGLPYPAPDWTYLDAEKLWGACTSSKGGQQRSGGTIPFSPAGPFPGLALLAGFGGAYLDSSFTRCLLGEPGSVRCGEWAFNLLWSRVCVQGDGTPVPGLATGQVVFSQGADPSILWAVRHLGTTVKWDFIPFPLWPVRAATIGQSGWYSLNAFASNPDLAWLLFKFVCIDTGWARFYMRLSLAPPAQLGLMEEWEVLVRGLAPVLNGKALRYWREPAQAGESYPGFLYFKYQPATASAAVAQTWGQIWKRQLSVAQGFTEIARQVNAIEVAGAAAPPPPTTAQRVAAARAAHDRFPTRGPAVATVRPGL